MNGPHVAPIVEWSYEKGYGFLRLDSQRIFFHTSDFLERHKKPEVGDLIRFTIESDAKGRARAVNASHYHDGGRFRNAQFVALIVLLIAPGAALIRLPFDRPMLLVVAGALSAITYLVYSLDKMRARARDWRIPESMLHLLEAAGGWPGAFIAQRRLRHKLPKRATR